MATQNVPKAAPALAGSDLSEACLIVERETGPRQLVQSRRRVSDLGQLTDKLEITDETRRHFGQDRPLDDPATPNRGVREGPPAPAARPNYQDRSKRPAHPSRRLVAQLDETWRVIADPLQWRLQRKKGNPRSKNSGWRDRSFCTTREGLLRCVREYCANVEPAALDKLATLPEHHCMQNLDVRGTDQARANDHLEPLPSKELEDCTAGVPSFRNSQSALT